MVPAASPQTGAMLKVRAKHTIVHDGQTLKAGTVFNAQQSLVDSLMKTDAVEEVVDDKTEPVALKPVHDPVAIAADKAAIAALEAKLAKDSGDGLGPTK